MPSQRSEHTSGLIYGAIAYALWGLFPLYFALLDAVPPIEVVAHRVVWSLLFMLVVIAIARNWRLLLAAFRSTRTLGLLALASIFIAINWGTYVYAVSSDQVVQASLGYIMNPLVSVALGVVILRERLRQLQWVAVGIAVIAVAILTWSYGAPPWISLVLAISFALYGLMKKFAGVGSVQSLTVETTLLAPIALAVIIGYGVTHSDYVLFSDPLTDLLLVLLGPITAVPLLAFGAAANRIPISSLGIMQYITPIMQFLIGVVIFSEPMPASRWIGFAVIWVAVVVFSLDMFRHSRRSGLDVIEPT